MKQLVFELLRQGPPHNQLLSPLTPYLGLCDNHAAVTVRAPFDHNQLLYRLRSLRYVLGDEVRRAQVAEVSKALGEMLGTVPGLTAELNRDGGGQTGGDGGGDSAVTHLRMILSASELALLPFEMSSSPAGFPGMGSPLLLQDQSPICLTREVRRTHRSHITWPKVPKVLFAYASPGSVGKVPWEDHLWALRNMLEPWTNHAEPEEKRFDEHLVVLKNASCATIQEICAKEEFSHVHILAHGIEYTDSYDLRFGIALHDPYPDPGDGVDRVSGERLASALLPVSAKNRNRTSRPIAVTLASCDSGGQGGVTGIGGSVVYALHEAGIPLVIGSLFPLSVAASSIFIRVLYDALLWADDPRVALYDLRRRLHTLFPTTHDWASITAYASFPENFEGWLNGAHIAQTYRSMEAAMKFADFVTESAEIAAPGGPTGGGAALDTAKLEQLDRASKKMEEARRRVEKLFDDSTGNRAELAGKLAATEKRCAQFYYHLSLVDKQNAARNTELWQQLLKTAQKHYWYAYQANRDEGWMVVQYLSLDFILRRLRAPTSYLLLPPHDEYNNPKELWSMARLMSVNDLRSRDDRYRKWALGNLVELNLLAATMDGRPEDEPSDRYASHALKYAKDLVDMAGPESFEVYSTRRQILRYSEWYQEIAKIDEIGGYVQELLQKLPASQS